MHREEKVLRAVCLREYASSTLRRIRRMKAIQVTAGGLTFKCQGEILAKLDNMTSNDDVEQPSRAVRAAADAALVFVGARLGGLDGAMLATFATPYAEDFLQKALGELKSDKRRRWSQMFESTAEATGSDPDELVDLIDDSERTRLLTAAAMTSAAGTAWPPKVYALGRALADGLIAVDGAEVNIADLVIPAMTDMERPHLSLLELLVRWIPDQATGQPLQVRAHQEVPVHQAGNGFSAGDFSRSGWTIGERKWATYQINQARPMLEPVLTSLIGTLRRHGLAEQFDDTPGVLAKFSEKMREVSSHTGVRSGQRITAASLLPQTMSEIEALEVTAAPRWSPTELGELVLKYYRLAAEPQIPQAQHQVPVTLKASAPQTVVSKPWVPEC